MESLFFYRQIYIVKLLGSESSKILTRYDARFNLFDTSEGNFGIYHEDCISALYIVMTTPFGAVWTNLYYMSYKLICGMAEHYFRTTWIIIIEVIEIWQA